MDAPGLLCGLSTCEDSPGSPESKEEEHLGQEVGWLNDKAKRLKSKKDTLKATPGAQVVPQGPYSYYPVWGAGPPVSQQYGSPGLSSVVPPGQLSAAAVPYGMAAVATTSPGQVGYILGYMYMPHGVPPPVYGSPHQTGGLAQFQHSSPMLTGTSVRLPWPRAQKPRDQALSPG